MMAHCVGTLFIIPGLANVNKEPGLLSHDEDVHLQHRPASENE